MASTVWERALHDIARGGVPAAVATELREHARRGVDCAEAFSFVLCLALGVAPRDPWLREQVITLRAREVEATKSEADLRVQIYREAAGWDRPESGSAWKKIEHGVDENDGATWCGRGLGHDVMEGMESGAFFGSGGWVTWTRRPAEVTCPRCREEKTAMLRLAYARGPIAGPGGGT